MACGSITSWSSRTVSRTTFQVFGAVSSRFRAVNVCVATSRSDAVNAVTTSRPTSESTATSQAVARERQSYCAASCYQLPGASVFPRFAAPA